MDDNFPNDIPVGFLGFFSGTDYAQACCFCGDMDLDELMCFYVALIFWYFIWKLTWKYALNSAWRQA